MARMHLARWCALLASLAIFRIVSGAETIAPEQRLWPMRSIHGVERVDVHDIAERFGLKMEWTRLGVAVVLKDAHGPRLLFESRQQDIRFDGLRIFLGQPVIPERDTLWVSLLDVIKVVAPLMNPREHADKLPPVPPRTIVIDPGHGGSDPGTHNGLFNLMEKSMTLDVALRLRAILEGHNWRVIMVRDKDVELSRDKKMDLAMRDEVANHSQADLFLSIHFNSAPEKTSGIETYSMAPQFMLSTGDETGDGMNKLMYPSNRFDYANLFFGEAMHRAMIGELKAPDRGFKRGRRAVLRILDCPGVLVECGYLSSNTEARLISTPEYREKIAQALFTGLQSYSLALSSLHPPPPPPKPTPVLAPPTRPVTAPPKQPSKR